MTFDDLERIFRAIPNPMETTGPARLAAFAEVVKAQALQKAAIAIKEGLVDVASAIRYHAR
jgi:hypothetical protein